MNFQKYVQILKTHFNCFSNIVQLPRTPAVAHREVGRDRVARCCELDFFTLKRWIRVLLAYPDLGFTRRKGQHCRVP